MESRCKFTKQSCYTIPFFILRIITIPTIIEAITIIPMKAIEKTNIVIPTEKKKTSTLKHILRYFYDWNYVFIHHWVDVNVGGP